MKQRAQCTKSDSLCRKLMGTGSGGARPLHSHSFLLNIIILQTGIFFNIINCGHTLSMNLICTHLNLLSVNAQITFYCHTPHTQLYRREDMKSIKLKLFHQRNFESILQIPEEESAVLSKSGLGLRSAWDVPRRDWRLRPELPAPRDERSSFFTGFSSPFSTFRVVPPPAIFPKIYEEKKIILIIIQHETPHYLQ